MTLTKICGITRVADAKQAARAGADFLGLNFWEQSKRHVPVLAASELAGAARLVRPKIGIVGLFVDADVDDVLAAHTMVHLDVVQLHGDESPATVAALVAAGLTVWKAHAVAGPAIIDGLGAWPAAAHVLDTPSAGKGGSGTTFDWTLAAAAVAAGHQVVLAGGLSAANVAAAIAAVGPYAVDVASGVESAPGLKDPARVTAFLAAVRGVH